MASNKRNFEFTNPPLPYSSSQFNQSCPSSQGRVQGFRTPTTSSHFPLLSKRNSRSICNKRFYIFKMQAQMNLIREEIKTMLKEISSCATVSANKTELRKTAKETAKRFGEYQQLLLIYNNVIDFHLVHNKSRDMKAETGSLQEKNKFLKEEINHLENLIGKRQTVLDKFNNELELLDAQNNNFTDSGSDEERKQYETLILKNKEYLDKILEEQRLIENERNIINRLKDTLKGDEMKEKKFCLLKTYAHCTQQLQSLQNELENISSNEDQRASIIQQIRKTKCEIETLSKSNQHLEEEIKLKTEKLKSFEEASPEVNTKKIEKIKEMKRREENMLKFLDTSGERIKELKAKIEAAQEKVIASLFIMKDNINNDEFENYFETITSQVQSFSPQQLQKQLEILQLRCERFELSKQKDIKEMGKIRTQISKLQKETESFSNIEAKEEYLEEEYDEAKKKQNILQAKLDTLNVDIKGGENELEFLNEKLNKNESYSKYLALEQNLEHINNEIKSIEEELNTNCKSTIIEDRLKEVLSCVSNYNLYLQNLVENGPHVMKFPN